MAFRDRLERRVGADQVGDVLELAGAGELRPVDQVETHQVGHVAGGDRLGELGHHLGVRDVGQVDLAVGVGLVPCRDEGVDHRCVAARPLPHLEISAAAPVAVISPDRSRPWCRSRRCQAAAVSGGARRCRRSWRRPWSRPCSRRRRTTTLGVVIAAGGEQQARDHECGQLAMCLHLNTPQVGPAARNGGHVCE